MQLIPRKTQNWTGSCFRLSHLPQAASRGFCWHKWHDIYINLYHNVENCIHSTIECQIMCLYEYFVNSIYNLKEMQRWLHYVFSVKHSEEKALKCWYLKFRFIFISRLQCNIHCRDCGSVHHFLWLYSDTCSTVNVRERLWSGLKEKECTVTF